MISVDEARDIIRNALSPCGKETINYFDADNRVLASDMCAVRTQPPFAASAMDGFALRSVDLSDTPTRLKLGGESAAGHAMSTTAEIGKAVHISTGAPVPEGLDQVVIRENTTRDGDYIILNDTPQPMKNIRGPGTDFSDGDTLLPMGFRLTPDAIALAAGAGLVELDVYAKPRIGILSTGDELVEPGEETRPDQIINSISKGLHALIIRWGGQPVYLGIARDTQEDVQAKLSATTGLDLVVTIGGASVGDHDHLRSVFASMGGELFFEKVAVKPGKPTWFGKLKDVAFLGLPGNPVSSLVVARLFLKEAIFALTGQSRPDLFQPAILEHDLPANGTRELFIRARRTPRTHTFTTVHNQDSSALSALAQSHALIRRRKNAPAAKAGDAIEILWVNEED